MGIPVHLSSYQDLLWCSDTQFGSGIAKALVSYISASCGGEVACHLDYPHLAKRLEFSEQEIRGAVGHLVAHDFARVTAQHPYHEGPVLELLTPGRKAHDARLAERQHRRDEERAAKVALRGGQVNRAAIPDGIRATVLERDNRTCQSCGSGDDLTLDHVYPWSLGGPDTVDNLQTLCRPCNSRKGDRV